MSSIGDGYKGVNNNPVFKSSMLSNYPAVTLNKKVDSFFLLDSQESVRGKFYNVLQILIKKTETNCLIAILDIHFCTNAWEPNYKSTC